MIRQGTSSNHINSLRSVLEVMLQTKDKVVHAKCREIAIILLLPVVESRSTSEESTAYFQLEVSWWLDTVTLPSLSGFCSLVSRCADDSLAILGRTGKALNESIKASRLHWSIIMIGALSEIDTDLASSQMTIQVATRSLLFQRNPIPFAYFITSLSKSTESPGVLTMHSGSALREYAISLVEFKETSSTKRLELLTSLLQSAFSPQHEFCRVLGSFLAQRQLDDTLYPRSFQIGMELSRFSIHVHVVSPGLDGIHESCNELLRRTIPVVSVRISLCYGTAFSIWTMLTIAPPFLSSIMKII
jgi:hypothetical protein